MTEDVVLALVRADHRSVMANVRLGTWMSAALDDPKVCDAMKADIREWFSSGHPPNFFTDMLPLIESHKDRADRAEAALREARVENDVAWREVSRLTTRLALEPKP